MSLSRNLFAIALLSLVTGCANVIAPTYMSDMPDILQIGGNRPTPAPPMVESAGSFCIQTTEVWKEDGKTPDGQTLWSKDTLRKVVPCR